MLYTANCIMNITLLLISKEKMNKSRTKQYLIRTIKPNKIFNAFISGLFLLLTTSPAFAQVSNSSSPNFGDGRDGDLTIASNTVYSLIDSSVSGNSGTNTLIGSNSDYSNGQMILVHQSRGTNAGVWEINEIQTYSNGVITTVNSLEHTYLTSGVNAAQVLVLKQYIDVTINPNAVLFAKPWNGSVGGILGFMANGTVNIYGSINNKGANGTTVTGGKGPTHLGGGFRGGSAYIGTSYPQSGYTGESPTGVSIRKNNPFNNGSGGGAGTMNSSDREAGGGGGGHGSYGWGGSAPHPNSKGGQGGASYGSPDLSAIMVFGSGGGGGIGRGVPGAIGGGNGGGIVYISAKTINITGSINIKGGSGQNTRPAGGGGGGAGGAVLLRGENVIVGSNRIVALGGLGSPADGGGNKGGSGGRGRVLIEYCTSFSGNTLPIASVAQLVCNDPPIAHTDFYQLNEGSTVQLDASGSFDPNLDPITYHWDLDDDGVFETNGVSPQFDASLLDGFSIIDIHLQVCDLESCSNIVSVTVTINNVAPSVTLSGPTTVNEGSAHTFSFITTDPGPDTFIINNYSCGNNGDLLYFSFDEITGAGNIDCTFQDGPNNSVVLIDLSDDDGYSNNSSISTTINNLSPTATLIADKTEIIEGQSVLLFFSDQTDPGPLDLLAGFTYEYDCDGDLVFETVSTDPSAVCYFEFAGNYFSSARIVDKDNGDTTYPVSILVQTPGEEIQDIINAIDELDLNGVNTAPLDNAIKKLTDDNPTNDTSAINNLQSMINQLEAQAGKKLSKEEAQALIDLLQALIDLLQG